MGQLEEMQIFARVVEAGSITKAAEQLNIAKSAVSKRLAMLESRLGIKLINRTTRTSSITEAGLQYYQRSKLIIDEIEELNTQTTNTQKALQGTLNVAIPLSFGIEHLAPCFVKFMVEHPELNINVHLSDRKVDIVEQGIDVAFRIGELDNSSMQARKIAPIRHLLCANEEYLKTHGTPTKPEHLKDHKILRYNGTLNSGITFIDGKKEKSVVHMTAQITANNGDFLHTFACAGHGIIYIPSFICWKAIKSKEVVPILTNYQIPIIHLYAVYPQNRHLPQKVRLLIDHVIDCFGEYPYWDQ